jgi:hypothetical protein
MVMRRSLVSNISVISLQHGLTHSGTDSCTHSGTHSFTYSVTYSINTYIDLIPTTVKERNNIVFVL